MIKIRERVAGERVTFYCAQSVRDAKWIYRQSLQQDVWALDTESTGLNPYRVGWQLRTFQFGHATKAYVLPARFIRTIRRVVVRAGVKWIGHNGPHDVRSLEVHCGPLDITCRGETYIPAHHNDSRNQAEGGTGNGLKDLCVAYVDPTFDRFEKALKLEFKKIEVPLPGQVYKSGPRKGQPKVRKAHIDEGWALMDPTHPVYVAYAASDPVGTYRLWEKEQPIVKANHERYRFDQRVQNACSRLTQRGMRLDIPYTKRLSAAYLRQANRLMERASDEYGCGNVQSGQQVAATLEWLGVRLTERTKTGQWTTDSTVLRGLLKTTANPQVVDFVRCVLGAKQLMKRRESYTEAMLREVDGAGRVHPSINSLGARTTRMSVSNPALQQLPTKDTEDELGDIN